jgi:hypothetical protein
MLKDKKAIMKRLESFSNTAFKLKNIHLSPKIYFDHHFSNTN